MGRLKFFSVIVVILSLHILSVAQDSAPNGQVIEKIVAKVDDKIILKSELDIAHKEFQKSQQFFVENLKCKVLETLIINKLLLAKATIDSVYIEPEQLQQQLDARMKQILQVYGADESVILKQFGKTIEDLKEELKDDLEEQMLVQKMQGKITSNIKITPGEVKKFFNEIPKDSLPFFSTELVVGHIVKIPTAGSSEKERTKNELEKIRTRIIDGENFGALAYKYSQDVVSAADSGRLGYFARGQLVPEYEATALNLQPGEVSKVIESQFGFHIIELLDKRGNEFSTRHILLIPKPTKTDDAGCKKFLDSLRTMIVSDSIGFPKAANKYSDDANTKNTGGFFTDETGSSRVASNRTDIIGPDLFFLVNKMKEGQYSDVIHYTTSDNKNAYRIVYLKDRVKAHEANLKDDYQKIYNAALSEKKNKAINDWFEKTKKEVFIYVDEEYKDCEILINQ